MKTVSVLLLAILWFGCGGYSSPNQASQPGIVPAVAAIMPASQLHGGSDFTLTVTIGDQPGQQHSWRPLWRRQQHAERDFQQYDVYDQLGLH